MGVCLCHALRSGSRSRYKDSSREARPIEATAAAALVDLFCFSGLLNAAAEICYRNTGARGCMPGSPHTKQDA